MKAVLISIQPKWAEKIASGEKTKKGCGAYHDVCEAYQAFRQEQATNKSEDAKTRFVANHAPYRIRRMAR